MASRASWLSSADEYGALVRSLTSSDPRLSQRDPKAIHQGTPWDNATARAVVLQKSSGDVSFSTPLPAADGPSLSVILNDGPSPPDKDGQRLVILQGLNPHMIGAVGSHFKMHPSFFLEHERVMVISPPDAAEGDGPVLPSTTTVREHKTFRYYENFPLPEHLKGIFHMCCADSGRHIGVTRVSGRFSRIGMLRRKCSLWRRDRPGGAGWDAVLLTDPPLRMVRISSQPPDIPIERIPLQGGYIDFIPHNVQIHTPRGPPRTSMMDDVCFYLTQHGGTTLPIDTPGLVELVTLKIIASHYMQHLEFVKKNVSHAQWSMSRHDSAASLSASNVDAQWSDVQALGRRVTEYVDDLEWIMLQCQIPLDSPDLSRVAVTPSFWMDTKVDFQFLHTRYGSLRTRAESLNSSMAALVGMAANQHALHEARRTRALTVLGLLFIPLAYVSSLFSMADGYLPGDPRFWLYFAVSLPLIIVVFAVYMLVDAESADLLAWVKIPHLKRRFRAE